MKTADLSWQNGQPSSCKFEDVYFSRDNGLAETEHVFLAANNLPNMWQGKSQFVIAETGFGSGLNFLTTLKHWLASTQKDQHLFYYSVELYPLNKADLAKAILVWPELKTLAEELLAQYPVAVEGFHLIHLCGGRVSLCLMFGDVLDCLSRCQAQMDVWFLDGFTPSKNPHMWSQSVFKQISRLSKVGTHISTFTAAGFVRRGLIDVGFDIKKVKGFAQKREMLAGIMLQPLVIASQKPWFNTPVFLVKQKKATIIGAGISGLTTAYALVKRGWTVKILEQSDSIASQASGNALALLMPRWALQKSIDVEFYQTAFLFAVSQLEQFSAQGFDAWHKTGVLQLAKKQSQLEQFTKLQEVGGFIQLINAEAASDLTGVHIADKALWYEQAGYCEPLKLCQFLVAKMAGNLEIEFNAQVNEILAKNNWQALYNNKLSENIETLILCNASQAKQFNIGQYLDIQPARGQVSFVAQSAQSQKLRCPIVYNGYVMPAVQQQHLLGATFSAGDPLDDLRDADDKQNINNLNEALPQIFNTTLSEKAGRASVRAVSHDRMPLLGAMSSQEYLLEHYSDLDKGRSSKEYPNADYYQGLMVNLAHGARGFVSSFICAEIIAAQLNNEPYPVSSNVLQALHPSRFVIKQIIKRKI